MGKPLDLSGCTGVPAVVVIFCLIARLVNTVSGGIQRLMTDFFRQLQSSCLAVSVSSMTVFACQYSFGGHRSGTQGVSAMI
jgi:hypothetical protein